MIKKNLSLKIAGIIMVLGIGVGLMSGNKIVQAYDNIFNKEVGWQLIDNSWYYYDTNKKLVTGWQQIDGEWYLMNDKGVLQSGWLIEDGKNYYLRHGSVDSIGFGSLVTGRCKIDNEWYYFDENGELQTGVFEIDGKEYYSNVEGKMITNQWVQIEDSWKYVKDDSSIATGDIIINDVLEKFDEQGNYIGSGEIGEYLYVNHLNVGNADCTFIKLPNGETVLIDTGDTSEKSTSTVIDFLKSQNLKEVNGVPTIDYIVLTHAHSDHIGGVTKILEEFSAGKVYIPEVGKMQDWHSNLVVDNEEIFQEDIDMLKFDYDVYIEVEEALKARKLEFTNTVNGEYIDSEKILKFVQSDKNYGGIGSQAHLAEYWGLNENSAVIYLNYGDFQELITGDIEWNAEADFVKNNLLDGAEVDVLRVPHHGHKTSSTVAFDKEVNATIGIISREKDEEGVDETAINNLEYVGTRILETNQGNGIEIIATSENWLIKN